MKNCMVVICSGDAVSLVMNSDIVSVANWKDWKCTGTSYGRMF